MLSLNSNNSKGSNVTIDMWKVSKDEIGDELLKFSEKVMLTWSKSRMMTEYFYLGILSMAAALKWKGVFYADKYDFLLAFEFLDLKSEGILGTKSLKWDLIHGNPKDDKLVTIGQCVDKIFSTRTISQLKYLKFSYGVDEMIDCYNKFKMTSKDVANFIIVQSLHFIKGNHLEIRRDPSMLKKYCMVYGANNFSDLKSFYNQYKDYFYVDEITIGGTHSSWYSEMYDALKEYAEGES